uniref:Uncharacterized protein n=1 Tax=Lepeophtheirus salmonis TaxID=72036 RepID=A0A0K2UFM2_LEPSM
MSTNSSVTVNVLSTPRIHIAN